MYNVLNTHSIGGQRAGRHWQSGADDLGIHGDIIGYHDTNKIPSSYTSYSSYLKYKKLGILTAYTYDDSLANQIQNIGVTISPSVFDSANKSFYTDYEIIFPVSIDPVYPSAIISASEYCKIKFRIYTFLQHRAYDDTSVDYFTFYGRYYQYDVTTSVYTSALQTFELWNYHTLSDLENNNYYDYYDSVGVMGWETLPQHYTSRINIGFSNTGSLGITVNLTYFVAPYGGYFSLGEYHYGVTASDPVSAGYIKYKNATVYNYRISPSYSVLPSDPTAYTYMDIYDATIYGRGKDRNNPSVIKVLNDTPDILVIPNMTRDYIYT